MRPSKCERVCKTKDSFYKFTSPKRQKKSVAIKRMSVKINYQTKFFP